MITNAHANADTKVVKLRTNSFSKLVKNSTK